MDFLSMHLTLSEMRGKQSTTTHTHLEVSYGLFCRTIYSYFIVSAELN